MVCAVADSHLASLPAPRCKRAEVGLLRGASRAALVPLRSHAHADARLAARAAQDPIAYALEALVPARFADMSRPSLSNHTILLNVGGQEVPVDSYAYVTQLYSVTYADRWNDIGCQLHGQAVGVDWHHCCR